MATSIITITTDDLDGSENAQTYKIINPEDGRTYAIDLSTANFDRLMEALAPFLDKARPASVFGSAPAPRDGRKVREYDKVAYRAWAEANGTWTGKRPTHRELDAWESESKQA